MPCHSPSSTSFLLQPWLSTNSLQATQIRLSRMMLQRALVWGPAAGCDRQTKLWAGRQSLSSNPYLEAADDAGAAMLNARAELLDLGGARALHGILEVDVLRHPDLRIKQRCPALVRQLLPSILQAPDHPCASLRGHMQTWCWSYFAFLGKTCYNDNILQQEQMSTVWHRECRTNSSEGLEQDVHNIIYWPGLTQIFSQAARHHRACCGPHSRRRPAARQSGRPGWRAHSACAPQPCTQGSPARLCNPVAYTPLSAKMASTSSAERQQHLSGFDPGACEGEHSMQSCPLCLESCIGICWRGGQHDVVRDRVYSLGIVQKLASVLSIPEGTE